MSKEEEYLILSSNVKTFEGNTITNFKTQLAQKRIFPPNEDWRVALTEITYKQCWYNVRRPCVIKFYNEIGNALFPEITDEEMTIKPGYYESITDIVNLITFKIDLHLPKLSRLVPTVDYSNSRNHVVTIYPGVELHNDLRYIPCFNREIEALLGLLDLDGKTTLDRLLGQDRFEVCHENEKDNPLAFEHQGCFKKGKVIGFYPADIKNGFSNLFVYSDLVQHSDVGNAFVQILTTLPNKHSKEGWGGSIHHELKNLIYRPLQKHEFDTIKIEIKDESGQFVPFKLGPIVLKLHFLKHG